MSPPFRNLAPAAAVFALALALVALRGVGSRPMPVHAAMGQGPTIALVHGLGSSVGDWLPVARILARRHRVVLIELPGHGESAMPEPFSLENAAESLDHALAAESRGPVVLVGHSVGGVVATAEALAHPERVGRLVLVEAMLRPQIEGADRDSLLRDLNTDYRDLVRREYLSFGKDSVQGEALYRQAIAQDSTQMMPWIRLAVTADLSTRAAGLRMPVLGVFTERTWPVSDSWEATAAAIGYRGIPEVRAERVPDSGHFIMLDHPEELARMIERFANGAAPGLAAAR